MFSKVPSCKSLLRTISPVSPLFLQGHTHSAGSVGYRQRVRHEAGPETLKEIAIVYIQGGVHMGEDLTALRCDVLLQKTGQGIIGPDNVQP